MKNWIFHVLGEISSTDFYPLGHPLCGKDHWRAGFQQGVLLAKALLQGERAASCEMFPKAVSGGWKEIVALTRRQVFRLSSSLGIF